MRNLIAIVSFMMSVIGGLSAMFTRNRDRQTMASIVAVAFLISFFINISREARLVLQGACIIAFAIAVTGGVVTIFSNDENKRIGAIVTGIVSLGTSLLILFMYLEFRLF